MGLRASTWQERIAKEAKTIALMRTLIEKRTNIDRNAKLNLCSFLRLVHPKRSLENHCETYMEKIKKVQRRF